MNRDGSTCAQGMRGGSGGSPKASERLLQLLTISYLGFKAVYGWLDPVVYVMSKVILPVSQVLFFSLVGRFGAQHSQPYYVIGNAIHATCLGAIFGLGGSLLRERQLGTLSPSLIVPRSQFSIQLGRAALFAGDGLLGAVLALGAGALLFSGQPGWAGWPALVAVLPIASLSATAFGLLLSSLNLVLSDAKFVMNVAAAALLVLSGANFDLELLPAPVRACSALLPLTRAVRSMRVASAGGEMGRVAELLAQELALAGLYGVAAFVSWELLARSARRSGGLERD